MIVWALAAASLGAEVEMALTPVSSPVEERLQIQIVAFNTAPTEASSPLAQADVLPGRLTGEGNTWNVRLEAATDSVAFLESGASVERRYELRLPSDAGGRLLLTVEIGGRSLTTVLHRRASPPSQPISGPRPAQAATPARRSPLVPAAAELERGFVDRFSPHESIYFIGGDEDPAIKFQFSFKYRLATLWGDAEERIPTTLQLGYTQRSLWDFDALSSPFYDSSYMPELVLQRLAPLNRESEGLVTWLGFQFGVRHQSNGRDAESSRSLNRALLRFAVRLGEPGGWNLILAPELYGYITNLEDNPQLDEYRKYGRLHATLNSPYGSSLAASVFPGEDFENLSYQLELLVPMRFEFLDLGSYFMVQYFNGYGESLLDFDQQTERLRAGISLLH